MVTAVHTVLNHSACFGALGAAERQIKVLWASGLACGAGVLVTTYDGIYCSLLATRSVSWQSTHQPHRNMEQNPTALNSHQVTSVSYAS